MPEPREARSVIENAEQAATAGDYAAAEDLLRKAAALQEQTLGPNHPDLANTLLSRSTTIAAVLFIVGALALGLMRQTGPGSVIGGRAPQPQSQPAPAKK